MIKNYYEILDLTRNASQKEITENFRKLALRYHPQATKQSPQVAAYTFSQICEAFEVLSDSIKRSFYDKFGYEKLKQGFYSDGKLVGGYRYANNPHQIFENFFKNESNLNEILDFKVEKQGSIFGHAFGGLENKDQFFCQDLKVKVPCLLQQLYKGATKTVQYQRKVLSSDGRTTDIIFQQKIIHIKPGYHSGMILQFPEAGHQTVHRTTSNLYFEITEVPHNKYQRKGDDLIYNLDISLADALECKSVNIKTLDGRGLTTGLDQIITPQNLHQIIGEGLVNQKTGKRGVLYIKFNIIFPQSLSLQTKKGLRSLLA